MNEHTDAKGPAGRTDRRFLRRWMTRRGNISVMFAFALIPISMLGLAAIDFHRASSIKMQLQDALDAATLATARSGATTGAAVQTTGDQVLRANLDSFSSASLASDTFTLNSDGTISSVAAMDVKPLIANLFLGSDMTVNASTSVVRANDKLEIALVLDNTGSMAQDNKMPTLISSATSLVNTLFASNQTGDPTNLKISVVPFTQTVKIGSTYQNATWISPSLPASYATQLNSQYSGLSWPNGTDIFSTANVNRFTLLSQMGVTWGGCVESRPAPYDAQDTAPTTTNTATLFVPYFAPDEPGAGNTSSPFSNDYLADGVSNSQTWLVKQGNAAKYTKAPRSGTSSSGYAFGPNAGCQMPAIQRLTTNQSSILSVINQMSPNGDTNLNIGMFWGWETLSPNAPFGDGVAYGTPKVKKIVVFLTDGWNEATGINDSDGTYYSGIGYAWQNRIGVGASASQTQRQAALDARTAALCTNMKAEGIIIYTVRIDVSGSQSPAVLQNCATNTSDFFDVPDVSNLNATFQQIANQIGQLRLSK
jgi:Flp pilus assembly protein TadG